MERRDSSYSTSSQASAVSFSETHEIFQIETLDEYTYEEVNDMWYSQDDADEMVEDALDAADIIDSRSSSSSSSSSGFFWRQRQKEQQHKGQQQQSSFDDDEDEHVRGLEKLTAEGSKAVDEQRQRVIRAVLEEQSRLRQAYSEMDNGIGASQLDDLLAEASYNLTMEDQDQAYERGYKDELASLPTKMKKRLRRLPSACETTNPNLIGTLSKLFLS